MCQLLFHPTPSLSLLELFLHTEREFGDGSAWIQMVPAPAPRDPSPAPAIPRKLLWLPPGIHPLFPSGNQIFGMSSGGLQCVIAVPAAFPLGIQHPPRAQLTACSPCPTCSSPRHSRSHPPDASRARPGQDAPALPPFSWVFPSKLGSPRPPAPLPAPVLGPAGLPAHPCPWEHRWEHPWSRPRVPGWHRRAEQTGNTRPLLIPARAAR